MRLVVCLLLMASATRAKSLTGDDTLQQLHEEGECGMGDSTCSSGEFTKESSSSRFDEEGCADKMEGYCQTLASRYSSRDEACIELFESMKVNCRKTCLLCDSNTRTRANRIYSENEGQEVVTEEAWEYTAKVDDYMYEVVYVQDKFDKVRNGCKNRNELCNYWGSIGECEKNPGYMKTQCAPACFSCEQLSFELRCPFDPTEPTVWSSGSLNKMFERIVTDPRFAQYNPQILSQPQPRSDDILKGPWVVLLDNFLTPNECKTLQELGAIKGYERSRDVGARLFDGTFDGVESSGRTSTNSWCTEVCWDNATTQQVHNRIENLIQVPPGNYEFLQLLKYEKDQFYERHHDYIEHHLDRYPGVRILTVFLYLNDVEEGGGTNFPLLNNMTVYPKEGRVLVWPSVRDQNPNQKDGRTEHQALPVLKGIKYGANAWVHQRDFKQVWAKGCH